MGFLQGPRLMTWTTKSTIQGDHLVPLGFKALLGSVKYKQINDLFIIDGKKNKGKHMQQSKRDIS